MQRFSWLHIVGLERIAAERWPNVRAALLRDLQQLRDKAGELDVVLCVGESTRPLAANAEDVVRRRLDELLAEPLFARRPTVVWLPGRGEISHERGPTAKAARAWDTDDELRDHDFWAPDSPYLADVAAAHAVLDTSPYRGAGEVRGGVLPGDAAWGWQVGERKVGLVALNSLFLAWAQPDGPGTVHARQIMAVCGGDFDVALLLTCHPRELLRTAAQACLDEFTPPGRFVAHLCSGTGASVVQKIAGAEERRCVQTPPLAGEGDVQGYVVGALTFEGDRADLRLWPRRLRVGKNGWRFTADDRWTLEDSGSTTPEPLAVRAVAAVARALPRELGAALRAEGVPLADATTVLGEVSEDRSLRGLTGPGPAIPGTVISPCFVDARLGLRAVHGHQGGAWHMGGSLDELVDKLCGPAESILAWDGRVLGPGELIELELACDGGSSEDPWLHALAQAVAGAASGAARGVLVVGAPGSGKTVWSQRIAGSSRGGLLGALGVAVRRTARDVADELRGAGECSWSTLAARGEPGRAARFAALARTGRLIPVIDGLDEISAADLTRIELLLRSCPGVWIATSRPEMRARLPEPMIAATLRIERLSPSQREALLRGMGRADLVARAGSQRARDGDAAATPLLAALEARVVRPGETSDTISAEEFHRRLFAGLLTQAERERRLTAANAELLHALLGDVVGKLALGWLRDSSRPLERGDIDRALADSGLGLPDRVHALRALEFGYLLRPIEGGWEFAHRTLAEWACAGHLRQRLRSGAPGGDGELAALEPLLAEPGSRSQGRWAQVLRFLAPHLEAPLALLGALVGPGSHLHWYVVRAHRDPDRRVEMYEAVGALQEELRFAAELLARQRWSSPALARRSWGALVRWHLWLRGRQGSSTSGFPREHLAPYSAAVPAELDEVIALVGATAKIRAELQADPTLLLTLLPAGCDATIAALLDRCTPAQQATVVQWCADGSAQLDPRWLDEQIQQLARRRSAPHRGLEADERRLEAVVWEAAIRTGRALEWDLVRRCAETWPGHLTNAVLTWFSREPRRTWGDHGNERRIFLGIVLHQTALAWLVLGDGLRFHAAGSSRYLDVLARTTSMLRQAEDHVAQREYLRWCAEYGAAERWLGAGDPELERAARALTDHVGVVRRWQAALQALIGRLEPAALDEIAGGLLVGLAPGSAEQEQLRLACAAARRWPTVTPIDEVLRCCEVMASYELRSLKLGEQHLAQLRRVAAGQLGEARVRTLELLAGLTGEDPSEHLLAALPGADETFVVHALTVLARRGPPTTLPDLPMTLQRRLPLGFQAALAVPGWHATLLAELAVDGPEFTTHLSLASEHHVVAALPVIVERLARAPAGPRFPASQALRAVASLATADDRELGSRALRAAMQRGWQVEESVYPGQSPSLWRFLELADVGLLAHAKASALAERALAARLHALGAPAYERLLASYRTDHAGQPAWTRTREAALENLFALVRPGETPLAEVIELCREVPVDSYTLSHTPGPLGAEFDEPEDQEWFSQHDRERLIGAAKDKLSACVHACRGEWALLRSLLEHPSAKLRAEAFARLIEVAPWEVIRDDALDLLLTAIRAPTPVISGDPRGVGLLREGRASGSAELPNVWQDSLRIVEGCLGVQQQAFLAALLASEWPALRLQGARWAGLVGLGSWCELLAPVIADPHPVVAIAAIEAVAHLDVGRAAGWVTQADRRGWTAAHYRGLLSCSLAPSIQWQVRAWRALTLPAELLARLLDEAVQVEPPATSGVHGGVFFYYPTLAERLIERHDIDAPNSWLAWTEHVNPRIRAVGRRLLTARAAINGDALMPLLASDDIADQQSAVECLTRLQIAEFRPVLMARWESWLPRGRRWGDRTQVPRGLEAPDLRLLWALRGASAAWLPLLSLALADIPIDSEDSTPTAAGDRLIELGTAVLQGLDLAGVVALVAAMDSNEVTVDPYFEQDVVRRALAEPEIRAHLRARPPGSVSGTILAELKNREMDGREQLQRRMLREVADP